jgi:CheY-like chemotaxis protein
MMLPEPMNNQPTPGSSAMPAGSRRIKVLAIDDNEEFRNLLKELLEPHGFEVVLAANPVKALEAYTRLKDSIELVLLDYYMPQLDGGKTLEWLRKLNPHVRVIICSGAEEMKLRQLQAQLGMDGYIHKPFRLEEALFVIKQVMAKKPRPA